MQVLVNLAHSNPQAPEAFRSAGLVDCAVGALDVLSAWRSQLLLRARSARAKTHTSSAAAAAAVSVGVNVNANGGHGNRNGGRDCVDSGGYSGSGCSGSSSDSDSGLSGGGGLSPESIDEVSNFSLLQLKLLLLAIVCLLLAVVALKCNVRMILFGLLVPLNHCRCRCRCRSASASSSTVACT